MKKLFQKLARVIALCAIISGLGFSFIVPTAAAQKYYPNYYAYGRGGAVPNNNLPSTQGTNETQKDGDVSADKSTEDATGGDRPYFGGYYPGYYPGGYFGGYYPGGYFGGYYPGYYFGGYFPGYYSGGYYSRYYGY